MANNSHTRTNKIVKKKKNTKVLRKLHFSDFTTFLPIYMGSSLHLVGGKSEIRHFPSKFIIFHWNRYKNLSILSGFVAVWLWNGDFFGFCGRVALKMWFFRVLWFCNSICFGFENWIFIRLFVLHNLLCL